MWIDSIHFLVHLSNFYIIIIWCVARCRDKKKNRRIEMYEVTTESGVVVKFVLVSLGREASSEEVLAHLEANGLRPATIYELVAFEINHSKVAQEAPVAGLGTTWINRKCSDYLSVPHVGGGSDHEWLHLAWFHYKWGKNFRFLATSK